jgi:hypothetical protein
MSTWLRKRGEEKFLMGYVVRRRGNERSFGDDMNWEKR